MLGYLHVTFLAHYCILLKTKDVAAFSNIFNVEISTIKVGMHTWYKLNQWIFTLSYVTSGGSRG